MKITNNQMQRQTNTTPKKANQQTFRAVRWGTATGTKRFIDEKFGLFGDPEGWAQIYFLSGLKELTVKGRNLIFNLTEGDGFQQISLKVSGEKPVERVALKIPELKGYKDAFEEQILIMAKKLEEKLSS